MTPQEYCARLERALQLMPSEERQETIRYYLEFLEEASEEERAKLGTPEQLAARILQENGIFPPPAAQPVPPKKHSNAARIILSICTFPIWLPLLLVWYTLLLTVLICIICIPLSFAAAFLGLVWATMMIMIHDLPMALFTLGVGVFIGGLAVLLVYPFWIACCAIVRFTVFTTKKLWGALWKGDQTA